MSEPTRDIKKIAGALGLLVIQRIRRVWCWLRGYHVHTNGWSSFRYDQDGICRDCGKVGSGISGEGE